jgi:hypothetical protein
VTQGNATEPPLGCEGELGARDLNDLVLDDRLFGGQGREAVMRREQHHAVLHAGKMVLDLLGGALPKLKAKQLGFAARALHL